MKKMPQRRALTNGRSLSASSHPVCVPKTSSVLIARPNRLNVSGDDRALLAPPGPVRLTVQVKERTCGRERSAPTSIDCAAAEGARSRSTHEWGSLVLGHAISMVSIGPQGHHDRPSRDSRTLASSRLPSVLAVEIPVPTAKSKRLTATANRLILAADERPLRIDLVRLDRTVLAAGCVASRDPCP